MTVVSSVAATLYVFTGPGVYTFTFPALEAYHIKCTLMKTGEDSIFLAYQTGYTVTLAPAGNGGSVTIPDPGYYIDWTDWSLEVRRVMPLTQEIDWVNNGPFSLPLIEYSIDKLTLMIQQIQVQMESGWVYPLPTSASLQQLLTDIKQIDGHNSGINADMLDGLHSSQFLTLDGVNNAGYITDSYLEAQNYVDLPTVQAQDYTTLLAVQAQGYTTLTAVQAQGYTTLTAVQAQGYTTLTAVQALGYTTLAAVQAKNYTTLAAVQAKNYTTLTTVQAQGYTTLTGVINAGYKTTAELITLGYKTISELTALGYTTLTAVTNLGYTTLTAVTNLGYKTLADLTTAGYKTISELTEDGYKTLSDLIAAGVATLTDVNTKVASETTSVKTLERLNASMTLGNLTLNSAGYMRIYAGPSSQENRNYVLLDAGNLVYMRYYENEYKPYKTLQRVEYGQAASGSTVVIDGWWDSEPTVIVSPFSLKAYDADLTAQSQAWQVRADNVQKTLADPNRYQFDAVAELTYDESAGTIVLNQVDTRSADTWTSDEYNTTLNTSILTLNVSALSVRGTGTSTNVYAYRKVVATAQLFNGTSWTTDSGSVTMTMTNSTSKYETGAIHCTGLITDKTKVRVKYVASDAGGTFTSGDVTYTNYGPYQVTANISGWNVIGGYGMYYNSLSIPGYTPLAGHEVYYAYVECDITAWTGSATDGYALTSTYAYPPDGATVGQAYRRASPYVHNNYVCWSGSSYSGYTINFSVRAMQAARQADCSGYITIYARAYIYTRVINLNSATASNTNKFISQTWTTEGASVIALGSLNWMAVGD